MSKISDIKKLAWEFPGSYRIIDSGRKKIEGKVTSWIWYTNPNNATSASYISWVRDGREGGRTIHNNPLPNEIIDIIAFEINRGN